MRKWILFILAAVIAAVAWLGKFIGVELGAPAALASLVAIITYILGEGNNDIKRIKESAAYQEKKWLDPAFWTGLVAALIPIINETFGLHLPIEIIVAVLTAILGFLLKKKNTEIVTK